jgi:hypothetical protein
VQGKQVFNLFLIVVHWHSDLNVQCLNLTVDRQFYFKKSHILGALDKHATSWTIADNVSAYFYEIYELTVKKMENNILY